MGGKTNFPKRLKKSKYSVARQDLTKFAKILTPESLQFYFILF
jgi:hypothetical protein